MHRAGSVSIVNLVRPFALILLAAAVSIASAAQAEGSSAGSLRAKHDALRPKLERNDFGRPLHLVSEEGSNQLRGDVYGVVNHAFAEVDRGFREASNWCDVLILPFNTKQIGRAHV